MAGSAPRSGKVTIFRQQAPEGLTYRIPALLYLPSESAFLAFAEKRSTPKDKDAKVLVMKRGLKKGMSVQWGSQQILETAVLPKHRTMNPCPVYEAKEGTVFLFFICVESDVTERHQIMTGRNVARLGYIFSRDGGRSWSKMADLTEELIGDDARDWATLAVGPGHGVQLSSGRLVVPAYAYYIHQRCFGSSLFCGTKPHPLTFYSDDAGRTWHKGQLLQALRASECQVAELTERDGGPVLYCNARSPDQYRVEAFSRDGGQRFAEAFRSRQLRETASGCQGSVLSFAPQKLGAEAASASSGTRQRWLMFCHPTGRKKRVNLGIFLNSSPLKKGSWKFSWLLNEGPSGYSDLAVWEEKGSLLFGCLFECGASAFYEEIAFRIFSVAGLLENQRKGL